MPMPQAQPATAEHVYLCTLFVDQGGLPLRKDQNPGNQLHFIGDGVPKYPIKVKGSWM